MPPTAPNRLHLASDPPRLASRHVLPIAPGFHELPAGGLEFLRFGLARVQAGQAIQLDTEDREALAVVLQAPADVRVAAAGHELRLPPRRSVFSDGPTAVYVPAGAGLELHGPLLAGVFQASAPDSGGEPYAILPHEVATARRGRGNFTRQVRDILPAERPASRLLAGETINPPGNWSSSPPHKHDRNAPPREARLEEVYLFRVHPAQGFALQHSYHAGGPSRTFAVGDLDAVAIPAGYHPVVAAPGYELYYLWCLAGEGRQLRWAPDPAHAWVESA
jgi:5-deoxy-glucuronate isomerase